MIKISISLLIALITLPIMVFGYVVIPVMLLFGWDGRTTIWGNDLYGTGETNGAWLGRDTFWDNFVWLAIRNPTNNLSTRYLSVKFKPYELVRGNIDIGDKTKGGSYWLKMGWAWEYYAIVPYSMFGTKFCVRFRAGWKIKGRVDNGKVSFVFAPNPFKKYAGN